MTDESTPTGLNRRTALKGLGAGAALAWAAPAILSVDAASAQTVFPTFFAASTDTGEVYYSIDNGATWLAATMPGGTAGLRGISRSTTTPTTWVVTSETGTDLLRSTDDAHTFSIISSGPPPYPTFYQAAEGSGAVFVTSGGPFFSGPITRSADAGASWIDPTSVPLATETINGLGSNGAVFVGTGGAAGTPVAWRSVDSGDNWTTATLLGTIPASSIGLDVEGSGGTFVLVGVGDGISSVLLQRSTDNGITYVDPTTVPANTGQTLTGVANNGAVYVVVGQGGTIWRSATSGDTWTNVSPIGAPDFAAVSNNGPIFIAVGAGGGIWRSTNNGITWALANTGVSGTPYFRGVQH